MKWSLLCFPSDPTNQMGSDPGPWQNAAVPSQRLLVAQSSCAPGFGLMLWLMVVEIFEAHELADRKNRGLKFKVIFCLNFRGMSWYLESL